MDYVEVGRHARIRRAIIDKNVYIPEGDEIGFDLERDRRRFFITDSGIVVIPKSPKRERSGRHLATVKATGGLVLSNVETAAAGPALESVPHPAPRRCRGGRGAAPT